MAGRTLVRQLLNIRSSDTYTDNLAAGVALETGAARLEDDLNAFRSQFNRVIGQTNWYDALGGRNLTVLDTDLTAIETKPIACNAQNLTDITVPGGQNFVILTVGSGEAPSQNASLTDTVEGAIVAASAFSGGAFAAHELVERAGGSAITAANMASVRDATTLQAIQSGGRDVFALLQYESTGVDGAAFNDTSGGNRVKLSFVRQTAGGDDLEAVPVADIENEVLNYNYRFCLQFQNTDKNCFNQTVGFVDNAASVDVTLDNAIDNQVGAVTVGQDIDVQLGTGFDWCFQDNNGADVFCVREGSAGGTTSVEVGADADTYVNNAVDVSFTQGATFDTGATPISIGEDNAGCIETTGATDDLKIQGGQELFFRDSNFDGSTWGPASGIKLSETTAEVDAFETTFGEVSLMAAVTAANAASSVQKTCALVTAQITANGDIGGVGGGTNLDTQLPDMSVGTFSGANNDYEIFINGILVEQGANAAADCDVYPGTSLVNGQLRHEEQLEVGDKICVIRRA